VIEDMDDSFEAGNERSSAYNAAGADILSDFFDFDGAALDTWINPGIINDTLATQQIQRDQDPIQVVFSFELLSNRSDSPGSGIPDIPRSKPLPIEPAPQNGFIHPICTTSGEHTTNIENRPQPGFKGFAIWDPNTELNADEGDREDSKTTKRRKPSPAVSRKKTKVSDDRNRKRAPNGTICVRCRLQKGKAGLIESERMMTSY
jgi:hypothetical protein